VWDILTQYLKDHGSQPYQSEDVQLLLDGTKSGIE